MSSRLLLTVGGSNLVAGLMSLLLVPAEGYTLGRIFTTLAFLFIGITFSYRYYDRIQ
jgi:hypothetical protein